MMEYWGMPEDFTATIDWLVALELDGTLGTSFFRTLEGSPWWELMHHAWWAGWRVLGFFVFPVIVIWASGDRLREQHLTRAARDFREGEEPPSLTLFYLVGLVIGVALVLVVSFTPHFQATYPFYLGANRSALDLLLWELMYAAQFFSLEFFFRGWWLRAGRSLGSHAIWAMMVPYVMIHVGKPLTETLAAIAAGLFLGTLAMRGRSIWPGFGLHCAVAVGMDLACLAQDGALPTQWAP
jgi:membrane protease YdiL (CAAX protease family)